MYPMDFYGTTVTKTDEGWDVSIVYRPTRKADKATARIKVTRDETMLYAEVIDHGRKIRHTKADQERVNELLHVACNHVRREIIAA